MVIMSVMSHCRIMSGGFSLRFEFRFFMMMMYHLQAHFIVSLYSMSYSIKISKKHSKVLLPGIDFYQMQL